MSKFLRIAVPSLLAVLLGCARPSRTQDDAGPSAASGPVPNLPAPWAASGSVEGRVLWRGTPPALPPLATSPSAQSVCGTSVQDNAFRLDGTGGVADVVVWVDAPPEAAPGANPGQSPVLDQKACLYRPPVFAARAGTTLRIRNSDPLTHTVHAFNAGLSLFNLAMPLEHMEVSRPLPAQPGVVEFRCDVHPWMHAVVRTFDHSHFTTTGPDGRFRLPGLPPGDFDVHAWHPSLGEASRRAHGGQATAINFEFGGKP